MRFKAFPIKITNEYLYSHALARLHTLKHKDHNKTAEDCREIEELERGVYRYEYGCDKKTKKPVDNHDSHAYSDDDDDEEMIELMRQSEIYT